MICEPQNYCEEHVHVYEFNLNTLMKENNGNRTAEPFLQQYTSIKVIYFSMLMTPDELRLTCRISIVL